MSGYRFVGFAVVLVVGNNLAIAWTGAAAPLRTALEIGNVFAWVGVLAWSVWAEKLTPAQLGFSLRGLRRSLAWGLIAGVALGLPPLLFFAFPIILARPLQYSGNPDPELTSLLALVFVRILLSTALYEETLFRGLIQQLGVGRFGPARGIGLSCGLFILWHAVVTYQTIGQTNLAGALLPVPILYVGAAAPLGVAGLVFSLIRHRTGNLAGSILAHWVINTMMRGYFFIRWEAG